MRVLALSVCLLSAGMSRVCGSEESGAKASAPASAAAAASAQASATGTAKLSAQPRFGGSLVAIGDHSVELMLHHSGEVEALVLDQSGQAVTAGVQLAVSGRASGGGEQRVELEFVPARARFDGQLKAGMQWLPGPVEVSLALNGKTAHAKLDQVAVVRGPELGGSMIIAGDHSAELLLRPGGEALAYVYDARGARLNADAGLDLRLKVQANAGAAEDVALAFDAARHCFAGKLKAGLEFAPGPLELSIGAKGGVSLGRLESIAVRVNPVHGGEVLVAGQYSVELVPSGQQISAFVFDAAGKASADANLDLSLELGKAQTLKLVWQPATLSYAADLAAGINLEAEPLRLKLAAGARSFAAGAASLKAILDARIDGAAELARARANLEASAKLDVDAKLDEKAKAAALAGAKLDAKVKVPNVKAQLNAAASKAANASASLKINPPKVSISKSANASATTNTGAKAGAGAKASAGFSFGTH